MFKALEKFISELFKALLALAIVLGLLVIILGVVGGMTYLRSLAVV